MTALTKTGLYSDAAYEALMLVSAFESFNLRGGLGTDNVYIHDSIFAPTVQRIVHYNTPNNFNVSWGYTAEIERSAEDGEIVIYDYSASSQTSNDWTALPNEEKKLRLACGIRNAFSYLTKAYPACSRKISLRIAGPCYAEPTNYMGRLAQFKNGPSRYRDFNIDLHTLAQLAWWFGDIHNYDNESYDDLIGTPWNPFRAKGLYEVRKQQKVIRDEFFEKLESVEDAAALVGDFKRYVIAEYVEVEKRQHKLEEGIL